MSLSGFANHCATANDWGAMETEGEVGCRRKRLTACSANIVAFDIRTSTNFQMSDVIQTTAEIAIDRLNLAGLRENQRKTFNQSPRPRCGDVPSQSSWWKEQNPMDSVWRFSKSKNRNSCSYRLDKLLFAIWACELGGLVWLSPSLLGFKKRIKTLFLYIWQKYSRKAPRLFAPLAFTDLSDWHQGWNSKPTVR